MTIQLKVPVRIAGVVKTPGDGALSYDASVESDLVQRGIASYLHGNRNNPRSYWPGTVPLISQLLSGPVKAATYGDSRARLGTANNNYAIESISLSVSTSSTTVFERAAVAYFYPSLLWVGDGGVAGETMVAMLARESAVASATRKSLDDLASTGAKVLFVRAGINDVTALTTTSSPASDPAVATIVANRKDILARAMHRFPIVIDEGLHGIAPTTPGAHTAYHKQVVLYLDQVFEEFAAESGGRLVFMPLSRVVGDGSGGFRSGMADNTGSSTIGAHLTVGGAIAGYSWLAGQLGQLLGTTPDGCIKWTGGPNAVSNPDFDPATASTQSYGIVASGVTINATGNATRRDAALITIGGRRFQVCTFDISASGVSTCQIKLSLPISGGSPAFPVSASDVLGVEWDVLLDDGAGGAPTAPLNDADNAFNSQLQIQSGGGNYTYWFASSNYEDALAPKQAAIMRICAPKIVVPLASASITGTDVYTRYNAGNVGSVRIGIGAPRIVKL